MGVQTQGGRDGQNGPPIISVIFFGRDDERGIRRCSWCSDSSEPKRGTSEGSGAAARDASFPFPVSPCRHPSALLLGDSLYFRSPTLHTQDIHWIDNEARGPGDPQPASGGPAHPSRLASPPSIEKCCAVPSACCADHPSSFSLHVVQ